MERCYVCNSCGKCAESALAVTAAGARSQDNGGHGDAVEKICQFAPRGTRQKAKAGPGASGAPAR